MIRMFGKRNGGETTERKPVPSDGLFHCRVSEVISTKLGMAVALSYSAFEGVVN